MIRRIPNATPDIQQAFRDIWDVLEGLTARTLDLHGRVMANAGDARNGSDLATLSQVLTEAKNAAVAVVAKADTGTGYDQIEDEGTKLAKRHILNFIGAGILAADGTGRTDVTLQTASLTLEGAVSIGTQSFLGSKTFKAASDSTTAYQFQKSDASPVLNIDTTNKFVGVGTATPAGTLSVEGTGYDIVVGQNSGANPKQLLMGYNTAGNYGQIQPIQQGVAYQNLALVPLGGTVSIGGTSTSEMLGVTGSITVSGSLKSTVATGTAPLVVASTTQVSNLNASQLIGATWAAPGQIGVTTPNIAVFTSLTLSSTFSSGGAGTVSIGNNTAATATNGTGEAVKANVEGYLAIDVGGTTMKVPYFKN